MNHTIEFMSDWTVDVEISPSKPVERLSIRKGVQLEVQLKPYVIDTPNGPIEVADLFFEDRSVTRCVPFALFKFLD